MSLARIATTSLAVLLVSAALPSGARAEIYECIDQNGNKRFTNITAEAKGCKVLNVGPVNTAPSQPSPGTKGQPKASALPTPANFPRVDRETQAHRDNDRRRILENELANEQKQLDDAKRDLAAQESQRLGDERNYQRVLDRLEPYKKKVKQHEDNVAAIRREIGNIR